MSLKERIQWLKFVVHSVPVVVKHHRINVAGDQGEEQLSRWCYWQWLALADVTDSELHIIHLFHMPFINTLRWTRLCNQNYAVEVRGQD